MAIDLSKPWHYIANGQTIGPISGSELVSLIGRGIVQASTKVWTPGQTGWLDASAYPDLFSASAGMAPPPPPTDMPADQVSRSNERWTSSASTSVPRTSLKPAGFWIRVIAYLIDTIVLAGLVALAQYYDFLLNVRVLIVNVIPDALFETWRETVIALMPPTQTTVNLTPDEFLRITATSLFAIVISLLYFVLLQASPLQATIGKAIVGIRLMRTEGGNVGLIRSLWRYLMSFLSGLLFGLGYLIAAFNRNKRALHDFLAGTRVVYRRR